MVDVLALETTPEDVAGVVAAEIGHVLHAGEPLGLALHEPHELPGAIDPLNADGALGLLEAARADHA